VIYLRRDAVGVSDRAVTFSFSMTYSALKKRRGGRGKGLLLMEGLVVSGPDVWALNPITKYKYTNYR